MTNKELDIITEQLFQSIDNDQAYFGFKEWTPHEFCIKANKDGLKSFAIGLLEVCKSDIDGTKMNLQSGELKWLNNDLDIQFIELTNKPKSELLQPKKEKSTNNWLVYLGLWLGLILLIYLIISGVLFTIQLI